MSCADAYVRKSRASLALIAVLLSIASLYGCSDSTTGAGGAGTSAESGGDGSLTLKVIAEVEGRDSGNGSYETQFAVSVTDTVGTAVSGATVTLSGAFGAVSLQEDNLAAGTYRAVIGGYTMGSYTLDVVRGADRLTGVTTVAPEIHTVTHPAANDSLSANSALNVRWTRPALADETRLETRDYDSSWFYGDQGTSWVPGVGNPPRVDQRLRVSRRNVQIALRGLPGSQLSVSVRRTVEPLFAN